MAKTNRLAELRAQLKEKNPSSLYLFFGEEEYLKRVKKTLDFLEGNYEEAEKSCRKK